jgi:hypothetical protein
MYIVSTPACGTCVQRVDLILNIGPHSTPDRTVMLLNGAVEACAVSQLDVGTTSGVAIADGCSVEATLVDCDLIQLPASIDRSIARSHNIASTLPKRCCASARIYETGLERTDALRCP